MGFSFRLMAWMMMGLAMSIASNAFAQASLTRTPAQSGAALVQPGRSESSRRQSLRPHSDRATSAAVTSAMETSVTMHRSAYERVQDAMDRGRLSLKEGVLLKSRLIHAPQTIPADSEFRPRPGEPAVREDCLTGFNKELHRAYPEFNESEKQWLHSLSPDLKVFIEQKERQTKPPAR